MKCFFKHAISNSYSKIKWELGLNIDFQFTCTMCKLLLLVITCLSHFKSSYYSEGFIIPQILLFL